MSLGIMTPMASVTKMQKDLGWETLERRRMKARVVMGFTIIHPLVAIPDIQFISAIVCTRGNQLKFIQIPTRTNYYKYSFCPAVIPLWNSLPSEIASIDQLDEFKQTLSTIQLTPS